MVGSNFFPFFFIFFYKNQGICIFINMRAPESEVVSVSKQTLTCYNHTKQSLSMWGRAIGSEAKSVPGVRQSQSYNYGAWHLKCNGCLTTVKASLAFTSDCWSVNVSVEQSHRQKRVGCIWQSVRCRGHGLHRAQTVSPSQLAQMGMWLS